MKGLIASGVLVAVLSASGGAAAPAPFPGSASWADAQHGWAPNPDYQGLLCKRAWPATGDSRLCSTEDGGRTWSMIFAGGNYIFGVVRTSAQAGIVALVRTVISSTGRATTGSTGMRLPSSGSTRRLCLNPGSWGAATSCTTRGRSATPCIS